MSTAAPPKTIRVALVGNPNTGKSTLFTALAGVRQRVGNYPGVTVEKKTGHAAARRPRVRADRSAGHVQPGAALAGRNGGGRRAAGPARQRGAARRRAVDRRRQQPGAESVSGEPGARAGPADGRGAEHGRPGPRPADGDRRRRAVASGWACRWSPCRPIAASGLDELEAALADGGRSQRRRAREPVSRRVSTARRASLADWLNAAIAEPLPQFLVERLLLDGDGYLESELLDGDAAEGAAKLRAARESLAAAGCRCRPSKRWPATTGSPACSTASSRRPDDHRRTTSDRIDAVLTHKVWGTLIFVAVMAVLFSSIFVLADAADGFDRRRGRLARRPGRSG